MPVRVKLSFSKAQFVNRRLGPSAGRRETDSGDECLPSAMRWNRIKQLSGHLVAMPLKRRRKPLTRDTASPSTHRCSKTSPETMPDPSVRLPCSMQIESQSISMPANCKLSLFKMAARMI